jgi:hypothetical protein
MDEAEFAEYLLWVEAREAQRARVAFRTIGRAEADEPLPTLPEPAPAPA